MKLTDLNPRWVGAGGPGVSDADGNPVPKRHGVGISFDCPCGAEVPKCPRVYIDFSNPLDGGSSHGVAPNRWQRGGDDFATLTITPSIQRVGGCEWHGFITHGELVQA